MLRSFLSANTIQSGVHNNCHSSAPNFIRLPGPIWRLCLCLGGRTSKRNCAQWLNRCSSVIRQCCCNWRSTEPVSDSANSSPPQRAFRRPVQKSVFVTCTFVSLANRWTPDRPTNHVHEHPVAALDGSTILYTCRRLSVKTSRWHWHSPACRPRPIIIMSWTCCRPWPRSRSYTMPAVWSHAYANDLHSASETRSAIERRHRVFNLVTIEVHVMLGKLLSDFPNILHSAANGLRDSFNYNPAWLRQRDFLVNFMPICVLAETPAIRDSLCMQHPLAEFRSSDISRLWGVLTAANPNVLPLI